MSGNVRWGVTPNGLACISAHGAEIKVATSVCTGGSNMPPAYCDWIIQVPSPKQKKKTSKRMSSFFWWARRDLKPCYVNQPAIHRLAKTDFLLFLVDHSPTGRQKTAIAILAKRRSHPLFLQTFHRFVLPASFPGKKMTGQHHYRPAISLLVCNSEVVQVGLEPILGC